MFRFPGGKSATAIQCRHFGSRNRKIRLLSLPASLWEQNEYASGHQLLGAVLKDGAKRASEHFKGAEAFAMHVGGQELPMHDPRQKGGLPLGVGYEVEPTPGRHTSTCNDCSSLRTDSDSKNKKIQTIRHCFNVMAGIKRKKTRMPDRARGYLYHSAYWSVSLKWIPKENTGIYPGLMAR